MFMEEYDIIEIKYKQKKSMYGFTDSMQAGIDEFRKYINFDNQKAEKYKML